MMGIGEIRRANRDPQAFAKSRLSDGQKRRNDAQPSNYWSEVPGGDRAMNFATPAPMMVTIDNRVPNGRDADRLPDYMDSLRLLHAIAVTISQAEYIQVQLKEAILRARLDNTPEALAEMQRITVAIMSHNPLVDMHLLVASLSAYVNDAAPNTIGYNPRDGLSFAMRPIKGYVNKMQLALSKAHLV